MIEEFSEKFNRDFKKLKREHRSLFLESRIAVLDAVEAYENGKSFQLPSKYRLKQLRNANGILALTWSFKSPDGRATFTLTQEETETYLTWYRVGTHEIFK
ncbi:MAG: hypothetical protein RL410_107 [Actinomycetota bacterium]